MFFKYGLNSSHQASNTAHKPISMQDGHQKLILLPLPKFTIGQILMMILSFATQTFTFSRSIKTQVFAKLHQLRKTVTPATLELTSGSRIRFPRVVKQKTCRWWQKFFRSAAQKGIF